MLRHLLKYINKLKTLYIREWGKINIGEANKGKDIDEITLNKKDWNFLADKKDSKYLRFHKKEQLQIKGFVGIISTSDNTQIEILPKINKTADDKSAGKSRAILEKMLKVVYDLNFVKATDANLQIQNKPLIEILIGWFLNEVKSVVKQGIRKDYSAFEAQEKFLKGQLQISKQLRELPHKQHLFHIKYSALSPNRAENRLIHSALNKLEKISKDSHNQKLIRHFLARFDDVPYSSDYKNDFSKWAKSRDMNYYKKILPWLRLILNQQSPFALKDKNKGISFLLPMHELFEKYVAKCLKKQLPNGYSLKTQTTKKYLTISPKAFQLKPDIAIFENQKPIHILDTKWKLIDQDQKYDDGKNDLKKGISQSDMYQLFAYGKKFKVGLATLIYPKWDKFNKGFGFNFDDDLSLSVCPFDLDNH